MSFKRSNKMTVREQRNVSELFALIEQSNDATLQELVDHRNLVRTFSTGMDGQSEEQSQFNSSNSEAAISNSQAKYDKEHERWRTVGTNGSDFNKNRAAVLRESGNRDALVLKNAKQSAGFDALSKAVYR